MISSSRKIILASSSAIRKEILEQLQTPFSVIASPFDEEAEKENIKNLLPIEKALYLAHGKGLAVSQQERDSIVISADQVCEMEGQIFDKPANKANAIQTLSMLAGKTHTQNNATCVFLGGKLLHKITQQAKLNMRNLSIQEIERYIEADNPLNACGAYKYESLGKHLFAKIEGSEECIKGLSTQGLLAFLYEKGILKFD